MAFRRAIYALMLGGILAAGPAAAADYTRDLWSPLHMAPQAEKATDAQCLACHREVLEDKPLVKATSGLAANTVEAWYQTLDTYRGQQDSFHRRHLNSGYAKQVMNLKCSTCHVGHDPREESAVPASASGTAGQPFTLRKQVNPEQTCLMCHGKFPSANMGLEGDWSALRADMESADAPNGCLTCHAEQFRTNRHKVNFLNAAAIEKAAQKSSDVCYGCHGGRAWYRISYPYPRHSWPGMPDEMPDWAKERPTESNPRFLSGTTKQTKK